MQRAFRTFCAKVPLNLIYNNDGLPWSDPGISHGLFNADLATGDIRAIEHFHSRLGITRLRHLDKAKPLGFTGFFVDYQSAGLHGAVDIKHRLKFCFCGRTVEISD